MGFNIVTGKVKSDSTLKAADLGVFPQEKMYTVFAVGDPSTAIAVAAAGSYTSVPVDMSKFDFGHGSIQIIVTGTGTCKLAVSVSRDGVSDLTSLGDIKTAMVAGSYIVSLRDAALRYGNFYHMVITETGGTAAVNVKALVMAKG